MTEDDIKQMIKYRMFRSKETLAEIPELLNLGYCNTAVNRIYYACYYAVNALLLTKGLSAKTHDGVRQLFGLHFVKTGLITKELARFYTDLFDRRQTGDYDDFVVYDIETVTELIQPADLLIRNIESIVNEKL